MDSIVLVWQKKPNKPHIQMGRGYYRVSGCLHAIFVPPYNTIELGGRWQKAHDFVHQVNEHIGFGGKQK